jgi:hypothetical protein
MGRGYEGKQAVWGEGGEAEGEGKAGGVREIQTLQARNLVHQNVEFCPRITLKLTYEHL